MGYFKGFECPELARTRNRALYPGCPEGRETVIAVHACRKYSGRVGRCVAAKSLDEDAITLAVTAHVRHAETSYDQLLIRGIDRHEARFRIQDRLRAVLQEWSEGESP